jgi:hypothetical protein
VRVQLILAVALLLQTQETPKETPELGKYAPAKPGIGIVDVLLNFYDQDDGGGNPNQKEKVTIVQPMLLVNAKLGERWSGSLTLQSDVIMAGSDSSSGASGRAAGSGSASAPAGGGEEEGEGEEGGEGDGDFGVTELQFAGALGLNHLLGERMQFGGGVSYSHEDNYESVGAYLRWAYETPDKNDAFGVRLTALFDTVELEYFDGADGGDAGRRTIAPGLAWTHVLTPRTLLVANYDLTMQSGELGTPAQSVVAGGVEIREELPDSRLRHAMHFRLRHLLLATIAVEPRLSYYTDSWGARAWSAELAFYWEVVPSALVVRPSYRYHDQSAVDYFVDDGAAGRYRTQDSDLGAFSSHSWGLKFTFLKSPLPGDELEIALEFADRSDGIEWFTVSVGLSWK